MLPFLHIIINSEIVDYVIINWTSKIQKKGKFLFNNIYLTHICSKIIHYIVGSI